MVNPWIPVEDRERAVLGLPPALVESGLAVPFHFTATTDYQLRRTTQGRFVELNRESYADLRISAGLWRDEVDNAHKTVGRFEIAAPLGAWGGASLSYAEGFKSPQFLCAESTISMRRHCTVEDVESTNWMVIASGTRR